MNQVTSATQAHLHIETKGQGPDLVLLHGWGVNSAVFTPLHESLSQYRVHYVDLPGFGLSQPVEGDLTAWVDILVQSLPANAIWAGWSLGGLVATQAALNYPSYVKGLITIASSPCFMAREDEAWPGIPPQVLSQFSEQLGQNLPRTIERFLAIQAMGSETAKEDIKQLRDLVLSRPLPDTKALTQGLSMLKDLDLRTQIRELQQPWLRVWGRLDGLVPKRVQPKMPIGDQVEDVMLAKASHAPFFSHRDDFLQVFLPWLAIHTR
ncbi:pimeloyl-ACP methyl ester esterase BioH [Shewanella profunda]|uniref:pimeloyl-ACP methyl ester esterase BioH n=1 Tax=Shewanella profunda TaxID=254793 RepID=UPI00200D98EF|nr:pimeloyl-ACP methyl ester esterase BioH [Shewanella profunda]MCL1091459.1 pimeloyl-ACP methyl ester esterase BioH [Shewanella profunda]